MKVFKYLILIIFVLFFIDVKCQIKLNDTIDGIVINYKFNLEYYHANKINRYIDYLLVSEKIDTLPLAKKNIYKIKIYNNKKSGKKLDRISDNILIFTKYILNINDSIFAVNKKDKKKLKLMINQEIVKIEPIPKDTTLKYFGWWRGRHGGLKIYTQKIE